ncbi:MAG TPA: ATP-binding protein [Vicinamibacterales bacterium]|nr:ATP-binding protein [Vicinamibacterales bacterium]
MNAHQAKDGGEADDRLATERALEEKTAWLNAVFDASRDGIIVEEHERIVFVNAAYVRLYGYERAEDLVGRHVSIVQSPADNERMLEFGRRRLAGEAVPEIYDFAGRRSDGSPIQLEASVAIATIADRDVIVTVVRDVSERRRAETERAQRLVERALRLEAEAAEKRMEALYREADEASRLKDEFLATLSHELRTPLNAMLGWARLLRSGTLDAETRDRALESIDRNTQLLAQLVSDILDVSRIITGKLRLDRGAVDLVPLIEAALDSLRPAAEAKGLRLELHVEGRVERILADADRLVQVVWNLLANAVKFTPEGGRIRVSVTGRDGTVEISIRDTGIGIAPAFLPYVFDRFRQADASTTRAHTGLGLGLSIVRHLVELHGGTVEAASEGPGTGACFTVRLPVRPAPGPSREPPGPAMAPRPRGPASTRELEGVRVLVVDDEADARALMLTTLQTRGAAVVTVGSAPRALDIFDDFRPDVLVADIGMPGEDGYSLIRKLRLGPGERRRHVRAIAVTAYARDEDRQAALSAGYDRHLAKPFEPAELTALVAALAGRGEG